MKLNMEDAMLTKKERINIMLKERAKRIKAEEPTDYLSVGLAWLAFIIVLMLPWV
tara:strand:- start:186 stop:350 length:165 start_codon:yes stop_codon:yes gene_type:complete